MRLGVVIDGPDTFFGKILDVLDQTWEVRVFAPRFLRFPVVGPWLNEMLLSLQLGAFLRSQQLVWFEWAGPLLQRASTLRAPCQIVVRLHSRELFERVSETNWARVSQVILVSRAMEHRFRQMTGKCETVVVHNGVSLDRFLFAPRAFRYRLGMVGLHPIKRVYEVVLIVSEMRSQGHPVELHIAGERNPRFMRYARAIERLVEKLDLSKVVFFDGFVGEMPRWFQSVDVFISNSYWEGQQVSLLEAMASGCFCLAHCWEGAEEVLLPENIFATIGDLQAKLVAYAGLPDSEKHQAQAQMRALAEAKFDERRMVREIVQVIESEAQG